MKKRLTALLVSAAVLLALLVVAVGFYQTTPEESTPPASAAPVQSPTPTPTPQPTPAVTVLRFSATGDNLIHNGIYNQALRRAQNAGKDGYDFSFCYDQVRDFYAGCDVNWLNQETLVNDELEPSTYPCFSTPGDLGRAAYDAGFRVFSLSNNHTYDKGAEGIAATRRFWASMPQDALTCGLYAGEADYETIPIQEKDGVRIAYLSYTEHTNGIRTPQGAEANVIYTSELEVMQRQLELARQQADLVIAGVHWGVEGSHTVTQAQRELAQKIADWGADVIIGTHPHVVQDAQWLTTADGRPAFVAYSLGNFLNAQSTADTMIGAVLSFTTSYENWALVMQTLPRLTAGKSGPAPLIGGGYSKLNLFGQEMEGMCGVAARVLAVLAGAKVGVELITTSSVDISLLVAAEDEDTALSALKEAFSL